MEPHVIQCTGDEFVPLGTRMLADAIRRFAATGRCVLGLAGGQTPGPVYEALSKEQGIDWNTLHVCLLDERYIPVDDARNNGQMIRRALGDVIPSDNFHFPDTSLPIDECVKTYDADMRALLSTGSLDVIVIGMGSDGHIASLFPPLTDSECSDEQFVVHTHTPAFAVSERITLTLPVLAAAKERVLLMKGEDKWRVWQEAQLNTQHERHWPLQRLIDTGSLTVIAAE